VKFCRRKPTSSKTQLARRVGGLPAEPAAGCCTHTCARSDGRYWFCAPVSADDTTGLRSLHGSAAGPPRVRRGSAAGAMRGGIDESVWLGGRAFFQVLRDLLF
jgi:hypothetical protein